MRPAWHAGNAYPQDPGELATMLDGFFESASSGKTEDGAVQHDAPAQLAAIMCPHIDLRAGGETYPPAFTALSSATGGSTPFELYVILGVAHNGGTEPGKSYAIATRQTLRNPIRAGAYGRSCNRGLVTLRGARYHAAAVAAPHRALG